MAIDDITKEKIRGGRVLFKGNIGKIAEYALVSTPTVKRYLIEDGLEIKNRKNKSPSIDDKFLILNAYYCFDGHGTEMSENLSWSLYTIWKVCKECKLRLKGKIRPEKIKYKYGKKEKKEILKIYAETGYNAARTAEIYGCSPPTVIKIARKIKQAQEKIEKSRLENL